VSLLLTRTRLGLRRSGPARPDPGPDRDSDHNEWQIQVHWPELKFSESVVVPPPPQPRRGGAGATVTGSRPVTRSATSYRLSPCHCTAIAKKPSTRMRRFQHRPSSTALNIGWRTSGTLVPYDIIYDLTLSFTVYDIICDII
jgi:hypothetical protein